MSILLKKYIRNLLNEIAKSKMTDDNPMWQEYKKLLASPLENLEKDSGPRFYNSVNRARKLKDFYRRNADQDWLNGPVENIIAIHSPTAFRVDEYSSYEECKNAYQVFYPCNTIIDHELSALGAINPDPSKLNSKTVLGKLLKSKSSRKSPIKEDIKPYYWLSFQDHYFEEGELIKSSFTANFYLNKNKEKNKIMTINKGLIPIEDFTTDDIVDLNTILSIDPKFKKWDYFKNPPRSSFKLIRSTYIGPDFRTFEPEFDIVDKVFFDIYLHLTPRRITHASVHDVKSNTYGNYPSLKDKNLTIEKYNNLSLAEFFDLFQNEINHDDYMQCKNYLETARDMPLDVFEEIKRRNRHLRQNTSSIDYKETRKSSGFKRYPNIYLHLHPDIKDDDYTVLDKDDLPLKDVKGKGRLYEINGVNYLGEIIVGHWQINELYVIKGNVDMNNFKKWMNGKLNDSQIKNDELQTYYRIRYFMECGIPVNIV
jgi:hypothetical protein